jgi:hypothetical protein
VLVGGGMLFTMGCAGLVRTSIRDGIFSFISGNVVDPLLNAQLNDFLLDVFTSNLDFFGSGALDPSTL